MGGQINFIIPISDGAAFCTICNCHLPKSSDVEEHITGKKHSVALQQFGGHIVRPGPTHRYFCKCCGCQILGWVNIYPHLTGKRHTTLMNKIDESLATCEGLPCNFVVRRKDNSHYCSLCDCTMSGPIPAQEHIDGAYHKESMELYSHHVILIKNNYQYCCKLCRCKFYGYTQVIGHVDGKRHCGFLKELKNQK